MKIGIDIRTLMDTHYSGVSEYTNNLLRELFGLDRKNQYKLFYNSGRDIEARMPRFREANVETIYTRYPNKLFNNIMQRIAARPKLDRLLGVDLFFMPNIGFVSLSEKAKKVITIHDLSFLRYPDFYSWKRRLWHDIINIKGLLKKFDRIIAISENTKQDIVELCGIPEDKVSVIYSGIGDEYQNRSGSRDEKELKRIKSKYQLPEKFILSLSTLEPRKNIDGVIQAYTLMRQGNRGLGDHKLVIAGAKGWRYQGIIEAWRKSEFKNDIIFTGYVESGDKPIIYSMAGVFVYPSFYEGFGFPPLEAAACCCPVITSTAASLPELIGSGSIQVDPYNTREISQALEAMLTEKELRDSHIEAGKKTAARFTWQKTAENVLRIFN